MSIKTVLIISSLFLIFSKTFAADEVKPPVQKIEVPAFQLFTGKVQGTRVRLRTQPTLEAPIVSQLRNGDTFIIQGETDEFYAVKPSGGTKVYVHRKFVLDGEIDGQRVNVRLNPDLDAPIIATLNTGDKVKGRIKGKWMEIEAPKETRFYVYKDYIENMGGPEIYLRLEKTRNKYRDLLKTASEQISKEFHRPFEDIQIDQNLSDLNQIVNDKENFPQYAAEAQQIIRDASEQYLQKKIAYLETLTDNSSKQWQKQSKELKTEIAHKKEDLQQVNRLVNVQAPQTFTPKSTEMLYWEPAEAVLYEQWASQREGYGNYETFYAEEKERARVLQGILTQPPQGTNNTPGDYVLVSERTRTPIAYLYSTLVDLRENVGHKVTVRAVERQNNHFAFPAYFVLSSSE